MFEVTGRWNANVEAVRLAVWYGVMLIEVAACRCLTEEFADAGNRLGWVIHFQRELRVLQV